ncbi:nucleotide-binding domain-containing protein [Streptomyces sp. JWR5-1]
MGAWPTDSAARARPTCSSTRTTPSTDHGPRIYERTRYRGRHYVEVWIVKDGKVVARGHHDVVIR